MKYLIFLFMMANSLFGLASGGGGGGGSGSGGNNSATSASNDNASGSSGNSASSRNSGNNNSGNNQSDDEDTESGDGFGLIEAIGKGIGNAIGRGGNSGRKSRRGQAIEPGTHPDEIDEDDETEGNPGAPGDESDGSDETNGSQGYQGQSGAEPDEQYGADPQAQDGDLDAYGNPIPRKPVVAKPNKKIGKRPANSMIGNPKAKNRRKANLNQVAVCGLKCRADKATAELDKKPFIPTEQIIFPSSQSQSQSQSKNQTMIKAPTTQQNNLRILSLLQKLQNAIEEKQDSSLPEFSANRLLRPSDKDDSIPALREILCSLGCLDQANGSPFFDMELEKGVKSFQASHCLTPDGIIGQDTKAKLNWSYEKRLKMVKDAIEKIKALIFTDHTIIVNIPTYKLYAFEKETPKMQMKVIVGKSQRQTPLMTSYINGIEYNPIWVVPKTILFEDELPKIQEDPRKFFAQNRDFQIFDEDDNPVNPKKIDWNSFDLHNFPYTLKQKSGKNNALGLLKFNLQTHDSIYLHDTAHRELFSQFSRALSSGCIRVEKAGKLASWLLNVTTNQLKQKIAKSGTTTEPLKENVTVHITYLPVWVEEDEGKLYTIWGEDPYNQYPKEFY